MLAQVNLSGVGVIAYTTGGLAATDARLRLAFNVDEDEMFVRFYFQCATENGADDLIDYGLQLDGALVGGGALYRKAVAAAPAAATHDGVSFEHIAKVARGRHVVALFSDQVNAASEGIDTGVAPCILVVEKISNEAVLAHGVDSKTFNSQ